MTQDKYVVFDLDETTLEKICLCRKQVNTRNLLYKTKSVWPDSYVCNCGYMVLPEV